MKDTGFWLALANQKDQYHQLATNKLNQLKEPLITTQAMGDCILHELIKLF